MLLAWFYCYNVFANFSSPVSNIRLINFYDYILVIISFSTFYYFDFTITLCTVNVFFLTIDFLQIHGWKFYWLIPVIDFTQNCYIIVLYIIKLA